MDFFYHNNNNNNQQQQQQSQSSGQGDMMSYTYQQQPSEQIPPEVNFNRSTQGFPKSAIDRATAAKLKVEFYYKTALDQAIERKQR
jgi:protein-serine/threonine kinase